MNGSVQRLPVTLVKREKVNGTCVELTLQLRQSVSVAAGQYISLKVENVFRPYSLISLPDEKNQIKLCIDILPGGPGSQFAAKAPIGTTVESLLPLGRFLLSKKEKPSLFIATGVGIAPFNIMIPELLKAQKSLEVTLLWGLRFEKDIYWEIFWQKLTAMYPTFNYLICLSQEQEQQKDNPHRFYGRVTTFIENLPVSFQEAYLCGNGQMINQISLSLQTKGILKEAIYFERYN